MKGVHLLKDNHHDLDILITWGKKNQPHNLYPEFNGKETRRVRKHNKVNMFCCQVPPGFKPDANNLRQKSKQKTKP